eukprot:sb/3476388/
MRSDQDLIVRKLEKISYGLEPTTSALHVHCSNLWIGCPIRTLQIGVLFHFLVLLSFPPLWFQIATFHVCYAVDPDGDIWGTRVLHISGIERWVRLSGAGVGGLWGLVWGSFLGLLGM